MTNKAKLRRDRKASIAIDGARKQLDKAQEQIKRLDPARDSEEIEEARKAAYKLQDMVTVIADRRTPLHRKFCENVRARRTKLGLTQKKVAELLGVTVVSFNAIELGRYVPGLDVIGRVSEALKCRAADLLD